jgi:hypothetical protein
MSERQQSRSKYEIVHRFIAYTFQWDEEAVGEPRVLEEGAIVSADTDFWKDKPWRGTLVVRFLCDHLWLYVDRETFLNSTRTVSMSE